MEKLYLKQEVPKIRGEVMFLDFYKNEIYRARGSFFPMPQKCCGGALPPIPRKYELIDANDQVLVEILRTSAPVMPEFKVVDLVAGVEICKIKKKFRISKPTVGITTAQGDYLIDGSIWHREFDVFDEQSRKMINMQKKEIFWGDTYEMTTDTELIDEHIAAGIILAIDCTYHSGN